MSPLQAVGGRKENKPSNRRAGPRRTREATRKGGGKKERGGGPTGSKQGKIVNEKLV